MMMMMRVMMRGHEPKQRQDKKKVRINLCLPPNFLLPLSPLTPSLSLCQHQTRINHTTIYPIPLSLSITFSPPFLVLCFSVICSQRHWLFVFNIISNVISFTERVLRLLDDKLSRSSTFIWTVMHKHQLTELIGWTHWLLVFRCRQAELHFVVCFFVFSINFLF